MSVRRHIGYGWPDKQDTREAHGEPRGAEEARLAKEFYGCDPDAQFSVPSQVREHFSRHLGKRGASAYASWMEMRHAYGAQYPDLADQLDHMRAGTLHADWDESIPVLPADAKGVGPRFQPGKVLNSLAENGTGRADGRENEG